MALAIGDITASSGLAKRIYDNWNANLVACGFPASPTNGQRDMLKAQAYCIAKGIVDEFVANGVSRVTIAQSGLQQYNPSDPGGLQDTSGPSSPRTIDGTIL